FSAANNRVLRAGGEPGSAGLFLLLNPDTEIRAGALDAAISRLESDPAIGMVGIRLLQPDGTFDHAAKRSFPTPLSALGHFTGLGRKAGAPEGLSGYRATWLDENEPGPVG